MNILTDYILNCANCMQGWAINTLQIKSLQTLEKLTICNYQIGPTVYDDEYHKHHVFYYTLNNIMSNACAILTVLGVHVESREAFVSHVRLLKRPRSMSSWYSMSLHGMYHSNQYMIVHIHTQHMFPAMHVSAVNSVRGRPESTLHQDVGG